MVVRGTDLRRPCTRRCQAAPKKKMPLDKSSTNDFVLKQAPENLQVGEEWVSKGWNELEHKGWLFKAIQRPAMSAKDKAQLSQNLV